MEGDQDNIDFLLLGHVHMPLQRLLNDRQVIWDEERRAAGAKRLNAPPTYLTDNLFSPSFPCSLRSSLGGTISLVISFASARVLLLHR